MKECTFQPKLGAAKTDQSVISNIEKPKYMELYEKAKPQIYKTDKTKQDYEFEK